MYVCMYVRRGIPRYIQNQIESLNIMIKAASQDFSDFDYATVRFLFGNT